LVTRAGQVKILDFGIARVVRPTGATHANLVLGTPAFMSPEQARGRWDDVDGQSDLFSLAATFFLVVTGRRVRDAATTNEELLLAMCERLPSVRVLAPEIPFEIAAVMDRALAFNKKDRWPSAEAMRQALRETVPALAPTLV